MNFEFALCPATSGFVAFLRGECGIGAGVGEVEFLGEGSFDPSGREIPGGDAGDVGGVETIALRGCCGGRVVGDFRAGTAELEEVEECSGHAEAE